MTFLILTITLATSYDQCSMVEAHHPSPYRSELPILDMEEQRDLIGRINSHFKSGTPAYRILDLLRQVPNPICVDFHKTLMDESAGIANPGAYDCLAFLRSDSTIVIISWAPDWQKTYQHLSSNHLLGCNDILMTRKNWEFLDRPDEEPAFHILSNWIARRRARGTNIRLSDLKCRKSRVAALFPQVDTIILIDDSSEETQSNNVFVGIQTQAFIAGANLSEAELLTKEQTGCTLLEAAQIARLHSIRA